MSQDQPRDEIPRLPQPFTIPVADRVKRLPPYLFGRINALKYQKRRAGADVIGWQAISDPTQAGGKGYNAEKDIEFYDGLPNQWFDVPAGTFAIFYPGDGHAPLGTTSPVTKLVVKVKVNV